MPVPDLARLRREYEQAGLDEAALPPDPLTLWQLWLTDAEAAGIAEINAMVVSTVGADGAPTSRMVLCKSADERGFVFFTNYGSAKGRAIAAEPRVSLLFPWQGLARQVRVEGVATQVPRAESAAYFATRPRGAQLSAWASAQSAPVADRRELEEAAARRQDEYAGVDVPCPPHWGGYRVAPTRLEFWQGRADRLHDRLVYLRDTTTATGWRIERLAP